MPPTDTRPTEVPARRRGDPTDAPDRPRHVIGLEPLEVRVARIEEQLGSINSKVEDFRDEYRRDHSQIIETIRALKGDGIHKQCAALVGKLIDKADGKIVSIAIGVAIVAVVAGALGVGITYGDVSIGVPQPVEEAVEEVVP